MKEEQDGKKINMGEKQEEQTHEKVCGGARISKEIASTQYTN